MLSVSLQRLTPLQPVRVQCSSQQRQHYVPAAVLVHARRSMCSYFLLTRNSHMQGFAHVCCSVGGAYVHATSQLRYTMVCNCRLCC
jgi:hypothetical protein